jgi:hypothetical protein
MDSIRGLMSRAEEDDLWAEALHLTDSIFRLFTAFIGFEFLRVDLAFSKFVIDSFIPLFEIPSCEMMVCVHLAPLVAQVPDESLLGIAEPLRMFLDRMFAKPSPEVCVLATALASRDNDDYSQYLIETRVIRLFVDLQSALQQMEHPAARLLRNFAACEAEMPTAFLFEPQVVMFMRAVFESASFLAQHECLMAVMLLLKRGLVKPVLATFGPAFICLPDVLEAGKELFCSEVVHAFGILLAELDGASPELMTDLRATVASPAMLHAFAAMASRTPLACPLLERLEALAD